MWRKGRSSSKTRKGLALRWSLRLDPPVAWAKTPLPNPHSRPKSCNGIQESPVLTITEERDRVKDWDKRISPTLNRTLHPYPKGADINEREQEIKTQQLASFTESQQEYFSFLGSSLFYSRPTCDLCHAGDYGRRGRGRHRRDDGQFRVIRFSWPDPVGDYNRPTRSSCRGSSQAGDHRYCENDSGGHHGHDHDRGVSDHHGHDRDHGARDHPDHGCRHDRWACRRCRGLYRREQAYLLPKEIPLRINKLK